MNNFIEFWNPVRGGWTSFVSMLTGILPSIVFVDHILLVLQIIALFISITVGVATLYNLHLKWKDRKNKK